jgi:hypothetical protein
MKTNVLIILIGFVSLTAFNLAGTFDLNNPSIKIIVDKHGEVKKGETIVFSVMLCSPNSLVNFSIKPNILGSNPDSQINFDFDENTKQASLNYFFIVPDNLKGKKNLEFEFHLKDINSETVKKEVIVIN